MNAYYSESMFRDANDELNCAGVCTRDADSELVVITPIATRYVTAVVLNTTDIVALVEIAKSIFIDAEIAEIAAIIGLDSNTICKMLLANTLK